MNVPIHLYLLVKVRTFGHAVSSSSPLLGIDPHPDIRMQKTRQPVRMALHQAP